MAYFSNGTEGMIFESNWCSDCYHFKGFQKGCPLFNAHLFYQDEGFKNKTIKNILNMLIKRRKCSNYCKFYIAKSRVINLPKKRKVNQDQVKLLEV